MTATTDTPPHKHWIDLPEQTYLIGQAGQHNIEAVQVVLRDPKAIVGALIIHKEKDVLPTVGIAHIDDPSVVDVSVAQMVKAIRGSFMERYDFTAFCPPAKRYRNLVTHCQAIVVCGSEGRQIPFLRTAAQTFWGQPVGCLHQLAGPCSARKPVRLAFDLETFQFLLEPRLVAAHQRVPDASLQHRIACAQIEACGQLSMLSVGRAHLARAVMGGVDTNRMNHTGDDQKRQPFQLVDLRKSSLTGFRVG